MLAPSTIQKIGSVLGIAWPDGTEHFLELAEIRKHCPCALCRVETDATGQIILPRRSQTEKSEELVGWQIVGGYGWQPQWADGHSTGIYTFEFLRRMGEESAG